MQININSVNTQKIQKALPKVNAYQSKIGDKTSMTKDKFVNNAVEEYLDKLKENGII
tara:strand:- start:253 stop:423 length:171 start_codon:yes stop_codon:yes gene_type:complete